MNPHDWSALTWRCKNCGTRYGSLDGTMNCLAGSPAEVREADGDDGALPVPVEPSKPLFRHVTLDAMRAAIAKVMK